MDEESGVVKEEVNVKQEKTSSAQNELYQVEILIENSEALTGYKKEVAAGALFSCNEKEMSKEKFKETIDVFLGKEVE